MNKTLIGTAILMTVLVTVVPLASAGHRVDLLPVDPLDAAGCSYHTLTDNSTEIDQRVWTVMWDKDRCTDITI